MEAWDASGRPVAQTQLLDGRQARKALLDGAVAAGHIEGAVHIALGSIEANLERLPKDRPILAYCGHGERSATALPLLERSGFSHLLNLNGGIDAWRDAGYKTVSSSLVA